MLFLVRKYILRNKVQSLIVVLLREYIKRYIKIPLITGFLFVQGVSAETQPVYLNDFKCVSNTDITDFIKTLEKDRVTKLKETKEKSKNIESTFSGHMKEDTKEWVLNLDKNSKKILNDKLNSSNKSCESVPSISNNPSLVVEQNTNAIDSSLLYIFISLGMKESNIKSLVQEAAKYGGVLVIRGLKNNSMQETVSYLIKLLKDNHEGIIIDPNLFRLYKIDKVPTFVLSRPCIGDRCNPEFDKISGNITARFALAQFKAKGALNAVAERLLK